MLAKPCEETLASKVEPGHLPAPALYPATGKAIIGSHTMVKPFYKEDKDKLSITPPPHTHTYTHTHTL
jgi:hypothetical protein